MFAKFAFILFATLVATQAYSLRQEDRAISDIIDAIKDGISSVISKISDVIDSAKHKIEEIISNIDIPGFVNKMQDKINKIVENAGLTIQAAKKCIDMEKTEVNQLMDDASASISKCKQDAMDQTNELEGEMGELKNRARELMDEVDAGVTECYNENGLNPIKLMQCLASHFSAVKDKVTALIKQAGTTIVSATKTAGEITSTLASCTASITSNLFAGEKQIIKNFSQCVDDLKTEQCMLRQTL